MPHCRGHHNVQLWPKKGEEQALIAAYSEGDSEDEETIKAWLDNKEWPGMNTLAWKEDTAEAATNLNTLRETYEYKRVLALTETATEVKVMDSDSQAEDSDAVPTAPLSPASPSLIGDQEPLHINFQDTRDEDQWVKNRHSSCSSCSSASMKQRHYHLKYPTTCKNHHPQNSAKPPPKAFQLHCKPGP